MMGNYCNESDVYYGFGYRLDQTKAGLIIRKEAFG